MEIEGIVYREGRGPNQRGAGFVASCEKYEAALLDGWRVYRKSGPWVTDWRHEVMSTIRQLFERRLDMAHQFALWLKTSEWRAERNRLGLCRSCKNTASNPGCAMCRQCLAKAVRDRTKCARAKVAKGPCRESQPHRRYREWAFAARHPARMRYWVNKRAKELDALRICKYGQRPKAVGYALCALCTLARRVHRPAHAVRGDAPIQLCE